MVGFCDLVGTGIAPVSTKTAVKGLVSQFQAEHFDSMKNYTFKVVI